MKADTQGVLEKKLKRLLPKDELCKRDVGVGPIGKWDSATPIEIANRAPTCDITYGPYCTNVISSRFKELLEIAAPGDFQFLPVRPMRSGRHLDIGTYWVANPLRHVDALNLTESEVGVGRYSKGALTRLGDIWIDPTLVPPTVNAFVLRYDSPHLVFVNEKTCRKLRAARLQGVYFQKQGAKREDPRARRKIGGAVKPMPAWKDVPVFEAVLPTSAEMKPRKKTKEEIAVERAKTSSYVHEVLGRSTDAEIELGKGCSAKDISNAEKKLGVKLPRSYKELLRTCGTATIEGEEIFGIPSKRTEIDFVKATLALRKWKEAQWPAHMIVIAADGRGGDFCLDVSKIKGDDCPVVYHDHELDEIDEKTERITPSFEKVTPTFRAWIKQIGKTGSMLPE